MYRIEIKLRYRILFYLVISMFIFVGIASISDNIILTFLMLIGIWLIFGLTVAKWKIKTNSIAFYGGGIKYVEIKYIDIINIYSYQIKLGWGCLFPIASENTVKLTYYNKRNEKIEFSFSLALDKREEFVSVVKQHMKESNRSED